MIVFSDEWWEKNIDYLKTKHKVYFDGREDLGGINKLGESQSNPKLVMTMQTIMELFVDFSKRLDKIESMIEDVKKDLDDNKPYIGTRDLIKSLDAKMLIFEKKWPELVDYARKLHYIDDVGSREPSEKEKTEKKVKKM